MMFQLICVSAEYFDDRFQMFFHGWLLQRNHSSRRVRVAGAVGMHWFGVASVPSLALLSTFIQATRAGSMAG
jgi:hypothetical protein